MATRSPSLSRRSTHGRERSAWVSASFEDEMSDFELEGGDHFIKWCGRSPNLRRSRAHVADAATVTPRMRGVVPQRECLRWIRV
jgi:hypothetical protein